MLCLLISAPLTPGNHWSYCLSKFAFSRISYSWKYAIYTIHFDSTHPNLKESRSHTKKIKVVCQSWKGSRCQSLDLDTRDWSPEPGAGNNLPYSFNYANKCKNILTYVLSILIFSWLLSYLGYLCMLSSSPFQIPLSYFSMLLKILSSSRRPFVVNLHSLHYKFFHLSPDTTIIKL